MKTKEQNKSEVINYLRKTSKHLFKVPKCTFNFSESIYVYDYDSENLSYMRIVEQDDEFYILRQDSKSNVTKVKILFNKIDGNTKCTIKHSIFLGKMSKSIKSNFILNI